MKTSLTVNPVKRNWNQLRITFGGVCRAFTERLSSGWKTLPLRWWHFPTSDLGREGFREEAVPAYFHSLSRECECMPAPASVTAAASTCLRLQTLKVTAQSSLLPPPFPVHDGFTEDLLKGRLLTMLQIRMVCSLFPDSFTVFRVGFIWDFGLCRDELHFLVFEAFYRDKKHIHYYNKM